MNNAKVYKVFKDGRQRRLVFASDCRGKGKLALSLLGPNPQNFPDRVLVHLLLHHRWYWFMIIYKRIMTR